MAVTVPTTALPTADASGAPGPGAPAPVAPVGRRRRGDGLLATVLLLPTVAGIVVFTVVPIVASLLLAFFRWDVITRPEFVGIDNFVDLGADPTVRVAFLNTIVFVVVAVTLQLSLSLWLAIMVQGRLPGWLRTFFRSAFFFPLVLSAASVSLVMGYLFNEDFGLVNAVLGSVGLPAVPWLTSTGGAAVVIVLVYVWQNFGFTFLLFLGGLAAIPQEVHEAASLDGARGWSRFRHVTLPLVSPTMLVASVMSIIGALQIFDQPYVLTRGGPGDSTRTAVMVVFESAFQQLDFGRAAAIGIVLTLLIIGVTAVQFRLSKRFVFYQ